VLLALGDDPVGPAVEEVLARRAEPLRVAKTEDVDELAERAAHDAAAVYIASCTIDDSGGADCVRRLARASPTTRAIVLFSDPADARRTLVSTAGAYDYIVSPDGDFTPLLAIIERMLTRSSLEARLDATQGQVRALVDNSNDGIYILKSGRFAYVNPRFERMVDIPGSELLSEEFNIEESIIAPASREALRERQRNIQQGLPVEPRYEFEALRGDKSTFAASVSVSYIEVDGEPATLGIMQDITERVRFEEQLVRKNRELTLLNELASSVNSAVDLDETLRVCCRRSNQLLGFAASGISTLSEDRDMLSLRVHEGLDDEIAHRLLRLPVDQGSLLAHATRTGEVQIVPRMKDDDRVTVDEVKETSFEGAIVVPLEARGEITGAAFFFTAAGRTPSESDKDLMLATGSLLGTAIERATLLEQERAIVHRLRAVDDIALAVSSKLHIEEVAEVVARSLEQMFAARRVLITRWIPDEEIFVPLCALDGGETVEHRALSRDESLMGEALAHAAPVERLKTDDGGAPYEQDLFARELGATVAVRVMLDDELVGAMHLGFDKSSPTDPADLETLAGLAHHMAVALHNAELFTAREQALVDLKAAQDKLVQSEKLHALGELAAGVAHDFNNVLGAILGRAQLLKKKLEDGNELRKHAEIIEKAANDGAETVRRIQEIGRQEKTDDFVPVSVHEILQDVVDLTVPRWRDRTRAENRPVDLELEPWLSATPMVSGNPHELREVLINLVHNAVDAMPEGGTIKLRARIEGSAADRVVIEIVDQGTGMPAPVKAKIFDPFFTTKGKHGTGLGLSVSYSIVQRHGGDLDVESVTEGEQTGTTFRISLPRLMGHEEPAAPAVERERSAGDDDRARVLVIDDEENIREILTDILETGDHVVVTAADGPEGLSRLDDGGFDLVVTDLGLPGMSGYEVASRVKERFPDMPVGLVTGWASTLDEDAAKENGVDLVLSKPFRFDQVLKLVDEALAARVRRA
jgi:PAS domain S-box-containing protein